MATYTQLTGNLIENFELIDIFSTKEKTMAAFKLSKMYTYECGNKSLGFFLCMKPTYTLRISPAQLQSIFDTSKYFHNLVQFSL